MTFRSKPTPPLGYAPGATFKSKTMDDIFGKILFFILGATVGYLVLDIVPFVLTKTEQNTTIDTFQITSNKADVYIDTVQFCNEPWWPTFTEMVPDVYNPGFYITKIDSADGGYRVYYTMGTSWGEYYWLGCKRSR